MTSSIENEYCTDHCVPGFLLALLLLFIGEDFFLSQLFYKEERILEDSNAAVTIFSFHAKKIMCKERDQDEPFDKRQQ